MQPALAAATAVVPVSDYLPEAPGLPGFRFYMVRLQGAQVIPACHCLCKPGRLVHTPFDTLRI